MQVLKSVPFRRLHQFCHFVQRIRVPSAGSDVRQSDRALPCTVGRRLELQMDSSLIRDVLARGSVGLATTNPRAHSGGVCVGRSRLFDAGPGTRYQAYGREDKASTMPSGASEAKGHSKLRTGRYLRSRKSVDEEKRSGGAFPPTGKVCSFATTG